MRKMMSMLLLALLLAGCAEEVDIPATDVLDAVLARVEIGDAEVFSLDSAAKAAADSADGGSRLSDEMLELLYGGAPSGASDGAVALSKSALGGEVHILRAGSLSQRGRLERILEERAALIAGRQNLLFLGELDEARLTAAVEVKGLYVMLFVTSDNPEAAEAALEMLE